MSISVDIPGEDYSYGCLSKQTKYLCGIPFLDNLHIKMFDNILLEHKLQFWYLFQQMLAGPKVKVIERTDLKTKIINKSIVSDKHELMTCKFGIDDMLVACGYNNGHVKIHNINSSTKLIQINTNKGTHETPVNCLKWRPTNQDSNVIGTVLLVANTNGNIYQYIAKTGKQIGHICEASNYVMALDYAPDALRFASGGKDTVVRIYDEETKKVVTQLKGGDKVKGHTNRIFCVKYKPDDPNLIASGGWDQCVYIWDIREAKVESVVVGPKIAGDAIDFRDNLILTGANRGKDQVELWDWRKSQKLADFRWDQEKTQTNAFVFGCQFLKSQKESIVAVGANSMKIFSLKDQRELVEIQFDKEESLYTVDTSSASNKMITGGKKGNMFFLTGLTNYE